jgi:adenine phosphoribosyltransferase
MLQTYEALKAGIRTIPGFPGPDINFRDISTLISQPDLFHAAILGLSAPYKGRVDEVVSIEARGLVFGPPIAFATHAGVVMARKQGKLPPPTTSTAYSLEYGTAELEISPDQIKEGDRIVVVDDLIATGGTAEAAVRLAKDAGAQVVGVCALIDLPELGGSTKLRELGLDVHTLIQFMESEV